VKDLEFFTKLVRGLNVSGTRSGHLYVPTRWKNRGSTCQGGGRTLFLKQETFTSEA